jgi:hypothetical protein
VIKSLGIFEKNSKNTQWVNCGEIASEPTMYSQFTPWVKPPLPPVRAGTGDKGSFTQWVHVDYIGVTGIK